MTGGLRWGVLTHAAGDAASGEVLAETVELAVLAERLGFDSFWVAQHHLGAQRGHVASPLVVLAAAAVRTSRIRLGTAVVVGSLEDPLRLAEDAATVDALSGGRLELGLGAGADPATAAAFGRDHARRHRDLAAVVERLLTYAGGSDLVPPLPGLRDRLWIGTSSEVGFALAARFGLGVLSGRRSGPEGPDDRTSADRLRRWTPPRVGLSRPVVPTDSPDLLLPSVRSWVAEAVAAGRFPATHTAAAHLAAGNVYLGTPDAVAAGLAADPCLPFATDLLCHTQPARWRLDQLRPVLVRIADQVRPRLAARRTSER